MFFKSMFKARILEAEAAWQANEGAARQQCLAALFMTSARDALQKCITEARQGGQLPDNHIGQCKQAVHLTGRDFKRAHFQEVHLLDDKYWVNLHVGLPGWWMPITYQLCPSTDMAHLRLGVARVRIHSPESPIYAKGLESWDQHVIKADKDRRRYFLF